MQGPQGESLSLGTMMPVYSGDPEPGAASLRAPCCDPIAAFTALYPQIAAAAQRTGFSPRELTGIVEAQPAGGDAAVILRRLRGGGEDDIFLAQAHAVAGFTEPWSFTLSGVMAPQPIFAAELPTLLQIWKSYRGAEPVFREVIGDERIGRGRERGLANTNAHTGEEECEETARNTAR